MSEKDTFTCERCGQERPAADRRYFYVEFVALGSFRQCEEGLARAMAQHAASGQAWERDFGGRPVYNYDTGEKIADTASEYRRRTGAQGPL